MADTRVLVGTSGWTYDDWAGVFYPTDVKGANRLSFYAQRFATVEVNATFYRTPTETMITAWNRRLPPGFHLVVKGSRLVTHLKRLRECDDPLLNFLDRVLRLQRLTVVLWQLPPSLHRDDRLLTEFLIKLPPQVRHAVEFRHTSWWEKAVARILAERNAAFVAVSHPRLPDTILPTADFLYVRFHGLGKTLYRYDYSDAELEAWAEALRPHIEGRTLYAFFNNDFLGYAPRNAATFRQMMEEAS